MIGDFDKKRFWKRAWTSSSGFNSAKDPIRPPAQDSDTFRQKVREERWDRSGASTAWFEAATNDTTPGQEHVAAEDNTGGEQAERAWVAHRGGSHVRTRRRYEWKRQRAKWQKPALSAKRRIALGEWLFSIKGYGATKRERYKRKSGKNWNRWFYFSLPDKSEYRWYDIQVPLCLTLKFCHDYPVLEEFGSITGTPLAHP